MKKLFFLLFQILVFAGLSAQTPSDFLQIHANIIAVKCAYSGCHDGSFEPDYRTVQSAYTTLVYHPVVKNNSEGSFRYRVVPFDTAASLLYERLTNCCFTNEGDMMPLLQKEKLSRKELDHIASWISQGARDWKGEVPHVPIPTVSFNRDIQLFQLTGTDKIRLSTIDNDFGFSKAQRSGRFLAEATYEETGYPQTGLTAFLNVYTDIELREQLLRIPAQVNEKKRLVTVYFSLPETFSGRLFLQLEVNVPEGNYSYLFPRNGNFEFTKLSWSVLDNSH